MAQHSHLGGSTAVQWGYCPAWLHRTKGLPNPSSPHAREGTAAHALGETVLRGEHETTAELLDAEMDLGDGEPFPVDQEMVTYVQRYVDDVNDLTPEDAIRMVEVRSDYSAMIEQEDAYGTADFVAVTDDAIHVHDLKYGKGIRVDAKENWQLLLYALGMYWQFESVREFKRVHLYIHQPRLNHLSEWSCSIEELLAFGEDMARRAARVFSHPDEMNPGEKQCRWCLAKATCPALAQKVAEEFDVLPEPKSQDAENDLLARGMPNVELIEGWCKAVRSETERRLLSGHHIKGFKLVEGRRGPRKWLDAKEAEEALKAMRVKNDDMYEHKLISPTSAEKLVKAGRLGPRQWSSLAAHITQSEGKPSVAKDEDPRKPLQQELDFEQIA